jgi:transglutaminase-like putative cysteine protease
MRYRATHTTRYRYDATVSQCQSEVRLTPRALPWQALIESRIEATPAAASVEAHKDYFGNDVTTFTILESHDRFAIVASSVVDVLPRPTPAPADLPWEAVRDELSAHARPETLEAFEYVFDSPFVSAGAELAAYARPSFPSGRGLLDAVDDLSHRIHAEFTYQPKATTIDTPLLDALKARRGVCQDFSHVMIGGLRSLRLAARYVSGYLRSGADYQGAEASHAWVSVYLPGTGWIDIDPTNDVRPGTGHVTLGWGRDYGDVTPVKGIALGGGQQLVDVEVRVEPIDNGEASPRANS